MAAPNGVVFPEYAGVLNVRDARFGAKGDGVSDDTSAIQKALTEGLGTHRVVYLPDGVYLVSDTLKWQNAANAGDKVQGWGPFLQLQGQSRGKTIIRLKENAPGFDKEDAPKAVLQTGSSGAHGGKTYQNGEGNEAFENHIRDFSVDTGTKNAGAVGIDYQASNCGAMRHVSIKGKGFCGIALTRRDNGPGLVKDVSIEGFRFGLRTSQEIAHFTLEDVTLRGQSEAGIWMRDSIVAARHITSQNSVPAIQMAGVSLLALFDSQLSGEGAAAIVCQGTEPRLYVRDLKTTGYDGSIRRRGKVEASQLAQWSSDAPMGNANGALSLNLPVRDTPEWEDSDPNNWADAGAPSGQDDTAQVQRALDAGKSTVLLRFGRYRIRQTLLVPPNVKRVFGVGAEIDVPETLPNAAPLWRLTGGKAGDQTIFDRLSLGGQAEWLFEHADARTLVVRDITSFARSFLKNTRGAGPLFIEDVAGAGFHFAPGTQIWARQWNLEGQGQPKAINDGATLWSLGSKHESAETILENKNGAKSEMWGGFAYTFGADANRPAYINTDANLVVQSAGTTYMGANGYFDLLVKDTHNGQTSEVRRAQAVGRGGGVTLPLYVSVLNPDTMNLKPIAAIAATTLATAPQTTAPATAQTSAKVFKAPEFFDGEETGKPTGNPLEVGSKPTWKAVQIWPDDPLKRDSYKPMNWAGDTWRGAYEFGGQPALKVEAGKIVMGVRGGWAGDGTMGGNKVAALVFIAPAKSTYSLSGIARAGVWQGEKSAASLSLFKSDPASGKITRVRSIPTPSDQDVPLENIEIELDAGQELALVPTVTQMYTAANVELRDLKIASGAPSVASEMKVGGTIEVGGKKYKVVKIDGKQITLEAT